MLRAIAINKQASSAYCNYVHVVVNTRCASPNFNPFFENGIKILFHDPSLSFSLSVYLSSWQDNYIHDAYLLLSKSHSLLFQIINYLITFTRWTRALLFKGVNLATSWYRSHNTMPPGSISRENFFLIGENLTSLSLKHDVTRDVTVERATSLKNKPIAVCLCNRRPAPLTTVRLCQSSLIHDRRTPHTPLGTASF